MGRYIRGQVDETMLLTVLAGRAVASEAFDNSVNERTLVSSIVATYSLANLTKAADVGPFEIGVAHSDYDTGEILEYLQSAGTWDEGNKISQEIGRRKIRRIGVFDSPDSATDIAVLNDGKPIKTKLNWILTQGQSLDLWVMNMGSAAVATTVPDAHAQGHVNLFPK